MIDIRVDSRLSEAQLDQALALLGNLRPLLAELGKTMEVEVRAHFVKRDAEGNKRGWARKHFWLKEGRANTALTAVDDRRAEVRIASAPVAKHHAGGEIRPQRKRMLALPLREEAYKKGSPKEWDDQALFAVKARSGKVFLVVKDGKTIRIMYLLVPKVNIPKDPRVLPNLDELARTLGAQGARFLQRLEQRGRMT